MDMTCIIHMVHFFKIFSHVSILHNPICSIINPLLLILVLYYYNYNIVNLLLLLLFIHIIIIINPLSLQLMLEILREGSTLYKWR
jgi:phosphoglycerol transferase MdoB-like AlkP superfamily enzyme